MYVGIVKRGIRGKLFFRLVKFTSLRLIFYYEYYLVLLQQLIIQGMMGLGVANEQVPR